MSTSVAVQSKLMVVLNGGEEEMNGATVPIQWFCSEELARKKPTHLLVVDYNDREFKDTMGRQFSGRRYFVRIDERVKFLQFFRPGEHYLVFAVISIGDPNDWKTENEVARVWLFGREHRYNRWLKFDEDEGVLRATFEEYRHLSLVSEIRRIRVPTEAFAQKPTHGWRLALWNYTNKSFMQRSPEDDCARRGRTWFFLPLKVLFHGGSRALVGLIGSLGLVIMRLAVLFAGWQPGSLFSGFADLWNFNRRLDGNFSLWDSSHGYKTWKRSDGSSVKMLVAGWELTVMALLAWFIPKFIWSVISLLRGPSARWILIVPALILLALAGFVLNKMILRKTRSVCADRSRTRYRRKWERQERRIVKQITLKKAEEQRYVRWLTTELSVSKASAKVDLNNLPKPAESSIPLQTFRVGFWALKAKYCKPYPID